jgi:hypothetical protein
VTTHLSGKEGRIKKGEEMVKAVLKRSNEVDECLVIQESDIARRDKDAALS